MTRLMSGYPTKMGARARLIHHDPILVCGAPRTGTSWTAKVLSLAGNVRYMREPFSQGGYASGARIDGFQYLLADDDDPAYESSWQKLLSLDPFLIRRWLMEQSGRWLHRTPFWPARLLIKEVNCPLALDWLTARFPFKVIITLRHPCAYVASGRRLEDVGHQVINLDQLICQPRLMDQFSPNDQVWIENLVDPVARMTAAYGIVYKVLGDQLYAHPEWRAVRHEQLCGAPLATFDRLCQAVDLTPGRRMRDFLDVSTNTADDALYSLNRLSAEQPHKWKSELSHEQINTVADTIERFRLPFYREFA